MRDGRPGDQTGSPLEQVSHETLAVALEHLDRLIADATPLPPGDLAGLVGVVAAAVAPLAHGRGIDLVMAVRGQGPLAGRDLRHWQYLLTQALLSFVEDLPAGSALQVDIGCVATTCGHRWLQADVAARPARVAAHDAAGSGQPAGNGGIRWLLVVTALRLLEGACDRAVTADGLALRLVAPVEA